MGEALQQLFEFVEREGGPQARMRIALITGLTLQGAPALEDSAENIQKLRTAIERVLGTLPPDVQRSDSPE